MKALVLASIVVLIMAASLAADTPIPIDEVQRGTMATINGDVERIMDTDEFSLADDTGNIRVYVGPNWVPVAVGETISVFGFVDDGIGPLELYARKLTRADGTVFEFEHRYE